MLLSGSARLLKMLVVGAMLPLLVACFPGTTNFDAAAVEQELKSGFSEVLSVEGVAEKATEASQGYDVRVSVDSAFVSPDLLQRSIDEVSRYTYSRFTDVSLMFLDPNGELIRLIEPGEEIGVHEVHLLQYNIYFFIDSNGRLEPVID